MDAFEDVLLEVEGEIVSFVLCDCWVDFVEAAAAVEAEFRNNHVWQRRCLVEDLEEVGIGLDRFMLFGFGFGATHLDDPSKVQENICAIPFRGSNLTN